MAYPPPSTPTRRLRPIAAVALGVLALLATGACALVGGDDDSGSVTAAATPTLLPTIGVPTPRPTATPGPTPTPVPLSTPTPTIILADTAFTNSSRVTTTGLDEVFFGMSPDEAARAASTAWVGMPESNANWPRCFIIEPSNGPAGVSFWVADRRIERVDVSHPEIRTPSALGVGTTLDELRSQLGDRVEIEEAGDGTAIATFTPRDEGDRNFRLVFEIRDGAVERYRSGRVTVVDRTVESCT